MSKQNTNTASLSEIDSYTLGMIMNTCDLLSLGSTCKKFNQIIDPCFDIRFMNHCIKNENIRWVVQQLSQMKKEFEDDGIATIFLKEFFEHGCKYGSVKSIRILISCMEFKCDSISEVLLNCSIKSAPAEARFEIITMFLNKLAISKPDKKELNLSGLGLREIPEPVRKFKQLTALYLDNNELTKLPKFIGELGQLETLDLSFNNLTEIPEFIGELKKLTRLALYGVEFPKPLRDLYY